MSILEVRNLVKKYKKADKNAVDDISFSVEEGEFFALLGPNGAGKTTTISILTTTLSKTTGDVTVAGYDLDKSASAVRQKVGIIFQNPSLDMNLTAEENIRFHAVLYGVYPFRPTYGLMPAAYKKRVLELAEVVGITSELFDPVKNFSGGMRRKLEIIRSLMHKPKILFLDEPTTGLDPASRKNLWNYLMKVRAEEKTTIFLTTHYLEEAESADRVCIISKGKIVSQGTPGSIKKELLDEYVLLDAKDRAALLSEIVRSGLSFEEDGGFKVKVGDSKIPELLKGIETPLTRIDIHSPTLEEAYLKVVEADNE